MVAYSFRPRFVDAIRSGLGNYEHIDGMIPRPKRQTIRAVGKRRHARAGEMLQLYTGMRTRQCKKIGEARCTRVNSIVLFFIQPAVKIDDWPACSMPDELNEFAWSDGFASWLEMREFWQAQHGDLAKIEPWRGVLIKWEPING